MNVDHGQLDGEAIKALDIGLRNFRGLKKLVLKSARALSQIGYHRRNDNIVLHSHAFVCVCVCVCLCVCLWFIYDIKLSLTPR